MTVLSSSIMKLVQFIYKSALKKI